MIPANYSAVEQVITSVILRGVRQHEPKFH